jgi:ABC-type Fe3+/spermidine/putrescine transport system ATPase subunit
MREEIRRLQKELSITAVYVTHDQEEAMAVSDRIAVMSQGAVVQEGTAGDLYHRPASAFVAQFIGRVNLLPGRVIESIGSGALVETAGARVRVAVRAGLPPGAALRLVVRPEALEIAADGELAGRVIGRSFLGEKVDYQVQVADQVLLVTRPDPGPGALLAEGQAVRLRLLADRVSMLAGAE